MASFLTYSAKRTHQKNENSLGNVSAVSCMTRFQRKVIFLPTLNAKIQLNKTAANQNSEGELKSVKPRTRLVFSGGIHFMVFLLDLEGFVISDVSQLTKTTSPRLIHV